MPPPQSPKTPANSDSSLHPTLKPMLPEFDSKRHGLYVRMLRDALTNERITNIALAGQYGSGKSSILDGLENELVVETKLKPLSLSLSTIDAKAARKRAGEDGDDAATGGILPITSLIQNEIVKQLLYRERPSKVRNSRFRRAEAFRVGPTVAWAVAVAVALVLAVVVYPRAEHIYSESPWVLRGVLLVLAATVGTIVVRRNFGTSFSLKELKAGPTTLKMDTTRSYFNEHLDELIYFFEVTKHRVVIFEDIDRFDDPHIFETLRELNTLLNSAKQLKSRQGPIRFIYATRDSVFDLSNEEPEPAAPGGPTSPAADRTKFFDIVVPVVPFVTHRTSQDMFLKRLGRNEITPRLLNLVSRYVTDMRLITNVCNEYTVFKAVILSDDGIRNLSADNLFAMIVYKNLYAADYEAVTRGRSKLDRVRRAYRDIVNDTAADLEAKIKQLRARQRTPVAAGRLLEAAATDLAGRADAIAQSLSGGQADLQRASIVVNGERFSREDLRSERFWETARQYPDAAQVQTLHWGAYPLPRSAIEGAFGGPLPSTTISESLMPMVDEEVEETDRLRHTVLQADLMSLFSHGALTISPATLDAAEVDAAAVDDFVGLVREIMGSPLSSQLIAAGFLDEHFAFYVADYPAATMSAAAAEYEMTAIERHQIDFRLQLADRDRDVRALIVSSGEGFLHDRRGYNVDILDALLADEALCPSGLAGMIRSLATGDREDVDFVEAYVANGHHQTRFIQRLAGCWPGIFDFLVSAGGTWVENPQLHRPGPRTEDIARSIAWLEAGITGSSEEVSYVESADITRTLELAAEHLSVVSQESPDAIHAMKVVTAAFRLSYPNIAPFSPPVRNAVVTDKAYKVNRENLLALVAANPASDERPVTPSLDVLRDLSLGEDITAHLALHVAEYADVLKDWPELLSVADPNRLVEVVDLLANGDNPSPEREAALETVLTRAHPEAQIDRLVDVPDSMWLPLVRSRRCRPSVDNLYQGLIEEMVAPHEWEILLRDCAGISVAASDTADATRRVALTVLTLAGLAPARRVDLVASLGLEEPTPASDVPEVSIDLLPELLQADIVEDSADTFTRIPRDHQGTRRRYISLAPDLADYIDAVTLTRADVVAVIDTGKADAVVAAMNHADVVATIGEEPATRAFQILNTHCRGTGRLFNSEWLVTLARAGTSADVLIRELTQRTYDLEPEIVREILDSLPEPYRSLGRDEVDLPEKDRPLAEALYARGLVGKPQKRRLQSKIGVPVPDALG